MSKLDHIMLDLETLSTDPNAVIVTIAAVRFSLSLNNNETEDFFVNINPLSSKSYGLHINKNTLDWWKNQKPDALKAWQHSQIDLPEAIAKFIQFTGDDDKYGHYWANGLSFDEPILRSSIHVVGKKEPWKYWNLHCARTAYYLANFNTHDAPRVGNYHSAIDDCLTQISWLKTCLNA